MRNEDIDKLNSLDTRVTVIEVILKDTSKNIEHHEVLIDRLATQGTELTLALTEISGKFDALISQISVGSKIIAAVFVLVSTLVSAAWIYQQDIDTKITANQTTISQQK